MGIYIGSNGLKNIDIGDDNVNSVYINNEKIRPVETTEIFDFSSSAGSQDYRFGKDGQKMKQIILEWEGYFTAGDWRASSPGLYSGYEDYRGGFEPKCPLGGSWGYDYSGIQGRYGGIGYYYQQTALNGKAPSTHSHAISDVTGLSDALNNKASASDLSTLWNTVSDLSDEVGGKIDYPSGGTVGQALKKTANGAEWGDISGLPTGGGEGQILMIVDGTPTWVTPAYKGFKMLSPSSPLNVPYDWYGSESEYSSATKSNDTEYRTL